MRTLVWVLKELGLNTHTTLSRYFKEIPVESRVLTMGELHEITEQDTLSTLRLPALIFLNASVSKPLEANLRQWRTSTLEKLKRFPSFLIIEDGPEKCHVTQEWRTDDFTLDYYVKAIETLFSTRVLQNYLRKAELDQELALTDTHIGNSSAMQRVRAIIERVQNVASTVLITGETGTGKELVAKAIHHKGHRKDRPLVSFNCGSFPDTLLESELFGHAKGAFTGATELRVGRLEQAKDGTIFLDEVNELSPAAQTKLLRVLQEREFQPLGTSRTVPLDARVIAATNKDMRKLVNDGQFREDLFYRLDVIPIEVPPLRQRTEDIPLLVKYFGMRIALKYAVRFKECDSIVLERLISYKWPGNIRELQNVMERLYALCTGSEIKYDDLPSNIRDQREDERILGNPAPRIELKNFDFYNANHMALLKEVLIRLKGNVSGAGRCLADEYGFGNMKSGASIKNRAGLDKSNIHLTIREFAEWYHRIFPSRRRRLKNVFSSPDGTSNDDPSSN